MGPMVGWGPALLGGGLLVGSVLLLEEDRATRYATVMGKYFLAEGVAHGHGVAVFRAYASPAGLLQGQVPRTRWEGRGLRARG